MTRSLIAYASSAAAFFILDMIWLGIVAKGFYRRQLGGFLLESPLIGPAALFYLIYLVGILVFAVTPALAAQSWVAALGYGALLGLVAYGTYDLSNLATLKGWPVPFTIVDLTWGTCLTAVSALAGYLVASRF
jgi:uncharacterized membrane protein